MKEKHGDALLSGWLRLCDISSLYRIYQSVMATDSLPLILILIKDVCHRKCHNFK